METATPAACIAPQFTFETLTTPIEADHHPVYGYMGHLLTAVGDANAAAALDKRRFDLRPGPWRDSLRTAALALYRSTYEQASLVKKQGNLLLCWPGTAVLKGVA